MNVLTAHSAHTDVREAVAAIRAALTPSAPRAVLYFASPRYEARQLARAMRAAFPGATTWGCSSAGELVGDAMLKSSLVALSLTDHLIEQVDIEVVRGLRSGASPQPAIESLAARFGGMPGDLDPKRVLGVVLMDGLSHSEERVMDRLGDLTNVQFVGGSAGDDLMFQRTWVHADGESYEDAAVLALIRPRRGFDIVKTQSFRVLDRTLVATRVDIENRTVLEFNGKPAVQAYAEALGVPAEQASEHFMRNPLGLIAAGEPYVRSPQRLAGEAMVFYCQILEGMELKLLESDDIVAETGRALESARGRIGHISALVNFHCILRTLELEKRSQTEAYGRLFADVPTVGFSTYGEAYVGHINQTSTMILFE
jgi:hypothetical protein